MSASPVKDSHIKICDISQGVEKISVDLDLALAGPVSFTVGNIFKYVKTNIPGPDCDTENMFLQQFQGCTCKDICAIESCACLQFFGMAYSNDGRLKETIFNGKSSRPVLECGNNCSCKKDQCLNRVVQRGINKKFQVFMTETKGQGLKFVGNGDVNIARLSFVCEYAGEVIGEEEARQRVKVNEDAGDDNYIIAVRERTSAGNNCIYIDPCYFGNLGRFINHSCDPNLIMVPVRINNPVPRLALFARRDITLGEELTFDYSGATFLSSSSIPNKKVDATKHSQLNFREDNNSNKTSHQLALKHKTFQDCNLQNCEEHQTCKKMKFEEPVHKEAGNMCSSTNTALEDNSPVNTENDSHTSDSIRIRTSGKQMPSIQREVNLNKNLSQMESALKAPVSQKVSTSKKETYNSQEVRILDNEFSNSHITKEVVTGKPIETFKFKRKLCYCGSSICTGFLPFDDTLLCD